MVLIRPFTQIPSEALAHCVELDHPAGVAAARVLSGHAAKLPIPHGLNLESRTATVSTLFLGRGKPLTKELQSYESFSIKTCPGKAVWDEEAEVWSTAVIPFMNQRCF